MQLETELPDVLFENIHQHALHRLANADKNRIYIGMHTVTMLINGVRRKTIIPDLEVELPTKTEMGYVAAQLSYRVAYNNLSFPIAHVFYGSGTLCLGNIPVPRYIEAYQLMVPLETLCLYNDHVFSHGHPQLSVSAAVHRQVNKLAQQYDVQLNTQKTNYLLHDTLWDLCAQLLEKYETDKAYTIAAQFFVLIFNTEGVSV